MVRLQIWELKVAIVLGPACGASPVIQLWNDHEIDITRKTSNSCEVTTDDVLRAASAAARKP